MKVILISGKARHGKDTVASLIKKNLEHDGYHVLITHYADLLKYICKTYFEWDGVKDERGRKILQYVGTDIVRKKLPNLWVDFVVFVLEQCADKWDFVIIPDCRFPNEVTRMRDSGLDTVFLRVIRDGFASTLTEEQQKHLSETALDDYEADYYIENNGTLADLELKVNEWIKENVHEQES